MKLSHWRHAIEGDIGTLIPPLPLCFPAAIMWAVPPPQASAMMYFGATGPKQQGQRKKTSETVGQNKTCHNDGKLSNKGRGLNSLTLPPTSKRESTWSSHLLVRMWNTRGRGKGQGLKTLHKQLSKHGVRCLVNFPICSSGVVTTVLSLCSSIYGMSSP
jgi:hypothetical protein